MPTTQAPLPLVLDSTEPLVLEAGLQHSGGKAILNSANLEDGEGEGKEIEAERHRVASPLVDVVIHNFLGEDEGVGSASERTEEFVGDRQKVQTWNRKDDSEREEERLERKRRQTEGRVEAGETWVEDGDERWRDEALMFAAADIRKAPVTFFAPAALDEARAWLSA